MAYLDPLTQATSAVASQFWNAVRMQPSPSKSAWGQREEALKILSGQKTNVARIYLVTWNVNGKNPPDNLQSLLNLPPKKGTQTPDIYAIGLQEVGNKDWEGSFTMALKVHDFVKVKQRRLMGIVTLLFVKRCQLPFVSNVESELTKTGLGGYWGNKGASSLRMDFMGMNLIVVNTHLQAHMNEVVERIIGVDAILDNQKFKDKDTDNIMDHDYVFWIGDLNFRLENLPYYRALDLIAEKDYEALLENDQLKLVIEEGLLFENFHEGEIDFPPTYKFDPGTDDYDTSDKQRVPAYTDRILFHYHKTTYGEIKVKANILEYKCHEKYKISDHRPVSALIEINVMAKGISGPVVFAPQKTVWNRKANNDVAYWVKKDFSISSSDWIGLYKADFHDFNAYVTYVWANTKVQEGASSTSSYEVKVRFSSAQCQDIRDGLYVMCYLTRKMSLCGISSPFEIAREGTASL